MKKTIIFVLVLALCLSLVGCGSSGDEAAPTVQSTVAATDAETLPTETEAVVETVPATEAVELPEYYKHAYYEVGYENGDEKLVVYDCRMYTLDNGYTRFEVDYKTIAGLKPVVFAHVGEDQEPAYWYELENPTTSDKETLVFEMETELLNQSYGPDIHFRNEFDFQVSWVLIYHTQQRFVVTEGNPVGESKTLKTQTEGKVKVHEATMQELDNGYIRFTVDCTPQKDRYISFYNPPEGDIFMCISQNTTFGGRETIVADVKQEDVEGLKNVNMNFFNGDAPVGRVYFKISN